MKSHGRNNHQRRQQNKNEQRTVNGFVPFFNSLHSRLRIEPQVLNVIEHNLLPDGGELQFSYTLDSGAETLISRNSVLITVEPLKKQETEVE